jgi:histidinol-phosphate/aromatic aminotransferase/cobyric acid decarboxylase-like protein
MPRGRFAISLASAEDREAIYAIRHDVYGHELRQHAENSSGILKDRLDEINSYIVAKCNGDIAGFVALTPPTSHGYSLDKYFSRTDCPFSFDEYLHEVRLLTITRPYRNTAAAGLLMYSAMRYLEALGATTIAAIGRVDVLELYARVGLKALGHRAVAGAVTYELMAARVRDVRRHLESFERVLTRLERLVDWQVPGVDYRPTASCYHGGQFFSAIGVEFDTLERRADIINADVLDAWFQPSPSVITKLSANLSFAIQTSPPTACEGMQRAIARARQVPEPCVLPGAGSSDLIFAGFRQWVTPDSRVLILDPMYGEYAHVLEKIIGVDVDRLRLCRELDYDVDCAELAASLARRYDWVILVNPNSPTGRHVKRGALERVLTEAPATTRFWIDETYVDYAGACESQEAFAASSDNVIVCKSMSKAYALSGVRAAYLCGPSRLIEELRRVCPPWSVSLPGQIAACEALADDAYYRDRWQETHTYRLQMQSDLQAIDLDVVPGCANFLLCHLPEAGPTADVVISRARRYGLFVRDVGSMGTALGVRAIRIAVKDPHTNAKVVEILKASIAS